MFKLKEYGRSPSSWVENTDGRGEIVIKRQNLRLVEPFPKQQILDSSKLKEVADDNFKLDENGRKFSKKVENTVGK